MQFNLPFIFVFIVAVWSRRKTSRRVVLLLGLSDSGKTLIFSRLLHDKFVNTYTSIKENVGDYIVKNSCLRIVDIPGHERLRYKFFDHYKNMTGGIVYVIDSVTFQKKIRDIAEFLYSLLSDPVVMANCPRFLILCNKQDDSTSNDCNGMQSLLEKEMDLLRVTKTRQLQSTEETGNKNIFLGKKGADFKFSHINRINVSFGEAAALNQGISEPAELDCLKDWLEESF
ncbi:signal recognition particle receptor subunit beta isoform X2 [Anabrus simplex]|uniref:signal recognition particle receptor subunit beta isoform X2 n=1 Tax=Anabrus simplex TaxID=316456 RepID=UPI0034DD9166